MILFTNPQRLLTPFIPVNSDATPCNPDQLLKVTEKAGAHRETTRP